jgi:hypothetical protein
MEQSPVVQKQTTLDTDHKKYAFFVGVFVTKILYTVSIDIIYCELNYIWLQEPLDRSPSI